MCVCVCVSQVDCDVPVWLRDGEKDRLHFYSARGIRCERLGEPGRVLTRLHTPVRVIHPGWMKCAWVEEGPVFFARVNKQS